MPFFKHPGAPLSANLRHNETTIHLRQVWFPHNDLTMFINVREIIWIITAYLWFG
jgi:hypothetical protein